MKKSPLFVAAALLLVTLVFSGCYKENEAPAPASTEQKLTLNLHNMVGTNAASYGVQFQTASGRQFNISDFRYYISNVVLIKNDGSELPISGKVILVNPTTNEYDLGKIPVGSYKGFKFALGLDSTANHGDPTIYSADHPLAIQTPSIHWDWNSGYLFMKIEGQVDTTLAANGPLDMEYFYHIGFDELNRNIDFTTDAFTVVSGTDYNINLTFDLLEALNNVDMRIENETHTMNNMPLAVKIADNWQMAFELN